MEMKVFGISEILGPKGYNFGGFGVFGFGGGLAIRSGR